MKLSDIKNILEAPIAGTGDMVTDKEDDDQDDESSTRMQSNLPDFIQSHTKLTSFNIPGKDVAAYESHDDGDIYIADTTNDQLRIVGKQELIHIGTLMGYNNVYSIKSIELLPDYRKQGISMRLYYFLVHNLNYVLVSGNKQYYGARLLWTKLSKIPDLSVDVINIKTQQFIARNINLEHGRNETEFDKKYWTRNTSINNDEYKNIRFILCTK